MPPNCFLRRGNISLEYKQDMLDMCKTHFCLFGISINDKTWRENSQERKGQVSTVGKKPKDQKMEIEKNDNEEIAKAVKGLQGLVKDLDQSQQIPSRCSDLADRITSLVDNINSLQFDRKQHNSACIQIHTCAVTLWNLAVAMKAAGKNSKSVNARLRHAACNLSFLANAFEATEHTYRKQLVMAAKTGKAWLECDDYAMADNSLQLANECWDSLQGLWSKQTDRISPDQERQRAESEQYIFSVYCYRAEAVFHMSQNDKTHTFFNKAKEMLHRLAKENARLSILSYNFGVGCYHNKEYPEAIEWLKESYELGKGKKPVGNKKQAVTLRLMARVYLDWDRREHLQKALNAVGLANSECPHPAGHYLKVELLLIDDTSTSSLQPVLNEALRHPDLTVQMGLNMVNLVHQYNRTPCAFECLRTLANRFQNSPDLSKIQLSHLELLLNSKQTQEAKDLVEDCINGHNTGRPLDVETRKMFHILLWEKAALMYDEKHYQEALVWYNYSLSLFTAEEKDGNKNLVKLLRNKCSCLIMLEDYSKAQEVAAEAVRIEPDSALTYFYQFKIALMQGNDELAIQAIGKMKDVGPKAQYNDVITDGDDTHALVCLAAQLSLEQNNRDVGIKALESLIKTSSSSKQIITSLRCLIRLKLTLCGNEKRRDNVSIQFYLQTAFDTINQMSSDEEDWQIEATWFMKIAWNMALESSDSIQEMREFFLICHKFADLCPIETTNMARQKNCQLMAAAASLQVAKEMDQDDEQRRNALKQALTHVQNCRDLCRRITAGRPSTGKDDIAVLLILYEFEAKAKLGEGTASLESCLQKAIALPYCEAETFETLAALAVEHPAYNRDICMKALRLAVKKYKTNEKIDGIKLSKVYHSLVELALSNGSSSDANSKEGAWKIYEEILQFMEGEIKGSYPEMEAIWLMTKSWNCGIHLFSAGRLEPAEKWCATAMRLLQQLDGFRNNYESKMTNVYSEILDRIEKSTLQTIIEE